MERTFAMIKPDAVGMPWSTTTMVPDEEDETKLVPKEEVLNPDCAEAIKARIVAEGFTIADEKQVRLSKEQAKAFYAEHAARPFYEDLTDFMSSGPVVLMVLEKEDAIKSWRALLGPTNSETARAEAKAGDNAEDMYKWTIRAAFGTDGQKNAAHGSDSSYSAQREIDFFFPAADALERTLCLIKPDVVRAGKAEAVVQQITAAGFVVVARKESTLTKDDAEAFYAEHAGKPFFPDLIAFMTRCVCVSCV